MSKKLLLIMSLLLIAATVFAQTATNRSYYVRADGDDEANNGRSEDAPFKTLNKAIEMAIAGVVKTITVIGTVKDGYIQNAGSSEILITGKPDASETEKALISRVRIRNSKVKLTHLQITDEGIGLDIEDKAIVTLGMGARITKCSGGFFNRMSQWVIGTGVSMESSILNMTDNAEISDNTNGGVSMSNNSTLNMSDNAVISGNTNSSAGGGVWVRNGIINMSDNTAISGNRTYFPAIGVDRSSRSGGGVCVSENGIINMTDNAVISGNTAGDNGGGVSGGQINMSGNAAISGNTAKAGGGVYSDALLKGGKITGNTAKQGGGVRGTVVKLENVEVSGNKAEYGAGIYVLKAGSGYKNAKVTITGGKITGNEAEFVGGGIYVERGAAYETFEGASVTGNKAGDGEGEDVFRQQ